MSGAVRPSDTSDNASRLPLTPRSANRQQRQPEFFKSPKTGSKVSLMSCLTAMPLTPPTTPVFTFGTTSTASQRPHVATPRLPNPVDDRRRARAERLMKNPLTRTAPQQRVARRDEYYLRQDQRRQEGSWSRRGDQILHSDFVTRQKAWEEAQARSAPSLASVTEEEMDDMMDHGASRSGIRTPHDDLRIGNLEMQASSDPMSQPGQSDATRDTAMSGSHTDAELEAIAAAEEAELNALLELHEASQSGHAERSPQLPRMLDEEEDSRPVWIAEHPSSEASRYGIEDDADFEDALVAVPFDDMDVS
ncbi:MAG: hypothetical protein M1828_007344 [Chrysothrix sp. TS-e1954]|nr:MAG: hypothetical protein M1828_007344 [Chrysothrix sp. TS-e1954]